MKAVLYERYGDRDVLRLAEVPTPSPGKGEVRVRVLAASINPIDGKIRRGDLTFMAGSKFPKRPGQDFAGIVEAVGDGVSSFSVGDAVFGCVKSPSEGAFTEQVIASAGAIARSPASLDAARAAAVPVVGLAALQALRDVVSVKAGDHVLVNGCTGGVGIFALQLAKRIGAKVTGVCGKEGAGLARELGADQVVDYRARSVEDLRGRYRAILELSGKLPFERSRRLLDERAVYADFSPTPASLVGNTLANPFRSHKHVFVMTKSRAEDLQELAGLLDRGELRPPPVQEFPLAEFARAFALAEGGGVIGKVVVRVPE